VIGETWGLLKGEWIGLEWGMKKVRGKNVGVKKTVGS
jgi:hypothetical protein